MDPFGISPIVDQATALSQGRVQSQMSVHTMKKALDVQGNTAIALIQSVAAVTQPQLASLQSASPVGVANLVDVVI